MSDTYKEKAVELLKKAKIGDSWTNSKGITRHEIIVDDEIIGHLWKDVKLEDVEVGHAKRTWRGWKVQLLHNGIKVGMIYITE